jgi:hypothetical protein
MVIEVFLSGKNKDPPSFTPPNIRQFLNPAFAFPQILSDLLRSKYKDLFFHHPIKMLFRT